MSSHRPLDDALACAVLVGAAPEQRAWLGGAPGDLRQLDGAEAAAAELFCRALARTVPSQDCRRTCTDALAYVSGTLTRRRRKAIAAHTAACANCAWMVASLPDVVDAVGLVASVYSDTIVGPPEAPARALRRPVSTATPRSRKPVVAMVAVVAVGAAGVGVAIAQNRRPEEVSPPTIVEPADDLAPSSAPRQAPTPGQPSAVPSPTDEAPDVETTPGSDVLGPAEDGTPPTVARGRVLPIQPGDSNSPITEPAEGTTPVNEPAGGTPPDGAAGSTPAGQGSQTPESGTGAKVPVDGKKPTAPSSGGETTEPTQDGTGPSSGATSTPTPEPETDPGASLEPESPPAGEIGDGDTGDGDISPEPTPPIDVSEQS